MRFEVSIISLPFAANAAPRDGFIEPSSSVVDYPTSLAAGIAKARGWRRYKLMMLFLADLGNVVEVSRTISGGDEDNYPTELEFVFEISNPITVDEENPPVKLFGEDAVQRAIARAMVIDEFYNVEYYDPTELTIVNNGNDVLIPRGLRLERIEIGKIANDLGAAANAITVNAI